jgi:hypothetical protein
MKQILASLGLITQGDESAWAVTSPDDRFRYILGRTWDPYFQEQQGLLSEPVRPLWVFGMLNPSKARGAGIDDPTIRKCIGFARRGHAGGFLVVNMLAYSATDPQDMVRAYREGVNVRGEHNGAALSWALSRPALLGRHIAAWGKIPPALRSLAQPSVVQFLCSRPECFGVNRDRSPKHPLMLGYDTPIVKLSEARS